MIVVIFSNINDSLILRFSDSVTYAFNLLCEGNNTSFEYVIIHSHLTDAITDCIDFALGFFWLYSVYESFQRVNRLVI